MVHVLRSLTVYAQMEHSQRESSPVRLSPALEKRLTDLGIEAQDEENGGEQEVSKIGAGQ